MPIFFSQISLNNNKNQKFSDVIPISSSYWNLTGTTIDIFGNAGWESIAASEPWCSGSGTWDNPYIIENVYIDGQNLDGSSLIEIHDSNVYFLIKNCTLIRAGTFGSLSYNSGIRLQNVRNGTILKNNISQNGYNGITMINCINNTIMENVINQNDHDGIYLCDLSKQNKIASNKMNTNNQYDVHVNNCMNNTLSENLIINEFDLISSSGIYLESCANDTLIKNKILNQTYSGIDMLSCNNELVSENNLTDNFIGINIRKCNNSLLSSNTVIKSSFFGISLSHECYSSQIENNKIYENEDGIVLSESNECCIYGNYVHHNNVSGISLSSCTNNEIQYNLVESNNYGINLYESPYNEVSYNNINYNYIGIRLNFYSDFNNITNNHLYCNQECISGDSTGNVFEDNICEDCPAEPIIPGFNILTLCIFLGVIYIFLRIKKNRNLIIG